MFERVTALVLGLALILGSAAKVSMAGELRDPMRPDRPLSSSKKTVRYQVSAIFISEQRKVAVVNGRTVVAGDQVDGARVVAIEPQALRLSVGDRVITAPLINARIRD